MRVLVIRNFDGTGLGQIATALTEADATIDERALHAGAILPETISGHDALVVLGGGQDALADAAYPYLPKLAAYMRGFAESGRAVMGVCLGSQLLARAYGAENLIGGANEFGWREVRLTEEGGQDPVLGVLPETFHSFQWHDDRYVLPRGGQRLAGNLVAHNQAFRVGAKAYGVQFHFEADRPLVADWSVRFANLIAERQPDWGMRHEADAARFGADADAAGLALAKAWVAAI